MSDITYKRFYSNLISPPRKVKPRQGQKSCGSIYVFVPLNEDGEQQVAILLEIIAMLILELLHTVLMMGS